MNGIASSPPRLRTPAAVTYLFEQHGIAHTEHALSAAHNGADAQHVIHIAPASDPRQVQAILDRAP